MWNFDRRSVFENLRSVYLIALLAWVAGTALAQQEVRIKDIATVRGVRDNQLLGVGLVTGLQGRGDSDASGPTKRSIANLVSSFGPEASAEEVRSKNSAIVTVTATVHPFAAGGDRIDVQVASLADAGDLTGGVLLQTPLKAANGQTYAVAQGALSTGGGERRGSTVAAIPAGAILERSIETQFVSEGALVLVLRRPDFTTAARIAEAIGAAFPEVEVRAVDASVVEVRGVDENGSSPVDLVAGIEQLTVVPDEPARVVVDENTGVVVLGGHVRIGAVGISYREHQLSVRPASLYADEPETSFMIEQTATVADFVALLQEIDVPTDTVIEMLKLIDSAGALYGSLVIR